MFSKDLNIVAQFLEGFFDSMSDVVRYSGTKVLNKENLAEHSYYVSVLADCLAEDIENRFKIKLDRYKIVKYALYHDIEEMYTGDIVTPVKYKSDDLREKFDEVGSLLLKENLEKHFEGNTHIASMILQVHGDYEKEKDEVLENMIVKCADILQALSYTMCEAKLGNSYLESVHKNLIRILKTKYEKHEYLGFYVRELCRVLKK